MTNHHLSLGLLTGMLLTGFAASSQAQSTISCESHEYRYNRCPIYTDGSARLISQESKAPCVRGQSWGFDERGIWVDKGCAGEFEVGGGSAYRPPQAYPERRPYREYREPRWRE